MTSDEFTFDATPIEKNVSIKDRQGNVVLYKLKEADGIATAAWRNEQIRGGQWRRKDKSGESLLSIVPDELGSSEAVLVGKCLFRCKDTNSDETFPTPVGETLVRSLPNRIVRPMFDWIMEVSDLREREEEDAPDPTSKRPTSTTDGSS